MTTPTLVLSAVELEPPADGPFRLRTSPQLTPPGPPDEARTQAARELRRTIDRDAQTELALDSASRTKDQDLATARFRANQLSDQNNALQRDLSAKDDQLNLWRGVGALGLVGSAVMGMLWVRSRRQRKDAFESVDSDVGYGFDSATDHVADSKAHQSVILSQIDTSHRAAIDPLRPSGDAFWEPGSDTSIDQKNVSALNDFSDTGAAVRDSRGQTANGFELSGPVSTTPGYSDSAAPAVQVMQAGSGRMVETADMRDRLLAKVSELTGTPPTPPEFESTALAVNPEIYASDASVHAHLPDVQFIPQPMQDLLLLYRGLQEWGHESRLGVAEQAFLHHISEHENTSGWVYLELLHLYRRKNERASFDFWADSYRGRFNRLAPTWVDAASTGKELLRYDLATLQLSQAWANDSVIWLLEQWLVGEPHMRRLMDIAAFREVFMLYELSLMVNDNPYAPVDSVKNTR